MVVSSPRSNWYVRAGSFSQLSFRGWATIWLAHIIIETYFRECNAYFRTIRQRLAAPIHRVLEWQQVFRS